MKDWKFFAWLTLTIIVVGLLNGSSHWAIENIRGWLGGIALFFVASIQVGVTIVGLVKALKN